VGAIYQSITSDNLLDENLKIITNGDKEDIRFKIYCGSDENGILITKNLMKNDYNSIFDYFFNFKNKGIDTKKGSKKELDIWLEKDIYFNNLMLDISDYRNKNRLLTNQELSDVKGLILHMTERYPELYIISDDKIYDFIYKKIESIAIEGKEINHNMVEKIHLETLEYAKKELNINEDKRLIINFNKIKNN